jgi:hypothetical protein
MLHPTCQIYIILLNWIVIIIFGAVQIIKTVVKFLPAICSLVCLRSDILLGFPFFDTESVIIIIICINTV